MLDAQNVKVNEMVLTGESVEVNKTATIVVDSNSAEKLTLPNMMYASTSLVEGRVRGVVLLTGMCSRVGSIAALLGQSTVDNDIPEALAISNARLYADQKEEVDSDADDDSDEDEEEDGPDAAISPTTKETTAQSDSWLSRMMDWCQAELKAIRPKRTPLQDELHNLGMTMTVFALTGAALVVGIGVTRNFRDPIHADNPVWLQSLMLAVSMAVSAIPEGLPLVVVICFALGTGAMAKKNTLIRRLPAVETLGSASIICSDKTGTLTSGKMSASKVWTYSHAYTITGDGYNPHHGTITNTMGSSRTLGHCDTEPALAATMLVGNLCNDAEVRFDPKTRKWSPIGTSTEAALVVATEKFGISTETNRAAHSPEFVIPFSSRIKMMATVHRLEVTSENGKFLQSHDSVSSVGEICVMSKGAPQVILSRCDYVLEGDSENTGAVKMTPDMLTLIHNECDYMSGGGMRVLALCYKRMQALPEGLTEMPSEAQVDVLVTDMVFCGLVGIMDPPRRGVRSAVTRARQGGVRTVMITGDYLKTAISIAKMVNILEPSMDEGEGAVDCSVLRPYGDYLDPRELDAITWHSFVFARARPEDKIQIVKSFQRQNFVVAMTGDGVNDAPALRQANIGVAMGITGSEVAKAASDMILTDDKFSSIVDAIELGRTIYGNLRKFVMYLIGSNWTQVLVILTSVLIGIPTPLEPLQILFVNLITDGMPAIALSIESPEGDVMKEHPRKKTEKILSGKILYGILGHALALMSFMIFIFFLGLWWNTGRVFLTSMFNEDGDIITTCEVLTSSGQWKTVEDDHCLEDGLTIARTMVFLTIALSECLRPLTARSFSLGVFDEFFRNKYMTLAIAFSLSCIFFITCTPVVQDIFHLHPPRWFEWLLIFVGVLVTIVSDEILKSSLRSTQERDRQWQKLFTRIQALQMEVRNISSHVNRVETNEKIMMNPMSPV